MPLRNAAQPALLSALLLLSPNALGEEPSVGDRLGEAARLEERSRTCARGGRAEEAEALAAQALSLRETVLGREAIGTIPALQTLAAAHRAAGRFAEAKAVLEETLELRARTLGANHPSLVNDIYQLGELERTRGDLPAAARHLEKARSLLEQVPGPRAKDVAVVLGSLALVRSEQGRSYDAEEIVDTVLVHLDAVEQSPPAVVPVALARIAFDSWARGETVHAEALYARLVAVSERAFGRNHPELAVPLVNLGLIQARRGEMRGGLALCQRALSLLEATVDARDQRLLATLERLTVLSEQAGREREARRYRARLAQATSSSSPAAEPALLAWQRDRD